MNGMENNGFMNEVNEPEPVYNLEDIEEGGIEVLEPEVVMIPEVGEAYVYGEPFEVGKGLISEQGYNVLNAQGDCGVVSVVNLVKMSGGELTEDEAIVFAAESGLCAYYEWNDPADNGGTTVWDRQEILANYGIDATVIPNASIDEIAAYVESGHGVNISVNAGYAWNDADYIGNPFATNHSIVVTGTARDPESGEVLGLYVCDSGNGSSAMFLSCDTLEDAYVEANGAALVTNDVIR